MGHHMLMLVLTLVNEIRKSCFFVFLSSGTAVFVFYLYYKDTYVT